jgi:5'(3')-deoxyribonucleotidase
MDEIGRGRVITDIIAQAHEEVSELGRLSSAYKRHLLSRPRMETAVVAEEVVDVLKCAIAAAQTFGLDSSDVVDAFKRKTLAIQERVTQERIRLKCEIPLLCFDLDDVICDLSPWRAELDNWVDMDSPPADQLIASERFKEQFYEGGHFRNMNPVVGAKEALRKFAENGFFNIILTARPQWQYKRLYGDTVWWLKQHHIPYHRILFNKDKVEAVYHHLVPAWPHWFVEDHERNIRALAAVGIRVLVYDQPHNRGIKDTNSIRRVHNWDEIERIVLQ